jgi:hypothetical protein
MTSDSKKHRIDWGTLKPSHIHRLFDDDIAFKILSPFIKSFKTLNMLACTNKNLNSKFLEEADARAHWIRLAAEMTHLPSRGFFAEKTTKTLTEIKNREELFDSLRALICPWTSTPVVCAHGGTFLTQMPLSRYMFVSEDSTRLVFQSRSEHTLFQISGPTEWSETWEGEVRTEPVITQSERAYLVANNHHFFGEIQARLANPLDMHVFTSTDPTTTQFGFHHVHGGVFAVMAHFNMSPRVLIEGSSGIYFFSYTDCRMLAHVYMHASKSHTQCSLQSRPRKLWILTQEWLMHHTNTSLDEGEFIEEPHVMLSKKVNRMDPALYMASQGDTEGLLYFLERDMSKMDINTQTPFNKRTVLHYAAKTGQSETVKQLLEHRAEAYVRDLNNETPLQLAVRGLHHETVKVILDNEKMNYAVFREALEEICAFDKLRIHIKMDEESVRQQCRVSIPSIVQSLFLNMPENPGMLEHFLVHALESKTVLSSAEAVQFIFHMGGQDVRDRYMNQAVFRRLFGGFESPEHEKEAIKTMIMTVDEFGMDINFKWGITQETQLIWAVRFGTLQAIKTLVEDLHADIYARANTGRGIRVISTERVNHSSWCRDRSCRHTAAESNQIHEYVKKLFAK